jgi:hypothetical protein
LASPVPEIALQTRRSALENAQRLSRRRRVIVFLNSDSSGWFCPFDDLFSSF